MEKISSLVERLTVNTHIRKYDKALSKQGRVRRILSIFGWKTFPIDNIYPEFSVFCRELWAA